MLPSHSELNFAKNGKFDLYTITNICFLDLALSMNMNPTILAVTKSNLANRNEIIQGLESFDFLINM